MTRKWTIRYPGQESALLKGCALAESDDGYTGALPIELAQELEQLREDNGNLRTALQAALSTKGIRVNAKTMYDGIELPPFVDEFANSTDNCQDECDCKDREVPDDARDNPHLYTQTVEIHLDDGRIAMFMGPVMVWEPKDIEGRQAFEIFFHKPRLARQAPKISYTMGFYDGLPVKVYTSSVETDDDGVETIEVRHLAYGLRRVKRSEVTP